MIFDLDGTLVDSMWIWPSIDHIYLGRFGYDVPAGLKASIEGMSFDETARYFKEHFPAITDSIEEMQQVWHDMSLEFYSEQVKLKPGAAALLAQAREQNYRLGIATSNSRLLTEAALRHLDVTDFFDAVITADEVSVGKPAPDVYLAAARRMSVFPQNCTVFEDVPKGILAARNADMHVVAVWDDQSADSWSEKIQLADSYITDFTEYHLRI